MTEGFQCDHHSAAVGSHRTGTPFTECGIFSAKVISKLPIVHSLDKLLGIVVGILETVLIVWTIYAFNIFRDLGTLGQVIVDYTRDSKILTCLYENNYLAYLIEQLGQKLPFFVK